MNSNVQYLHLPPGSPPPPLDGEPFAAIVVIEADVTAPWRRQASRWLVAGGCRYVLAWGKGCSQWDDAVDEASIDAHAGDPILEDAFVVTTWHDDEALEDVFAFAKHHAAHPSLALDRLLVVHIADVPRETLLRDLGERA